MLMEILRCLCMGLHSRKRITRLSQEEICLSAPPNFWEMIAGFAPPAEKIVDDVLPEMASRFPGKPPTPNKLSYAKNSHRSFKWTLIFLTRKNRYHERQAGRY